MLMLDSVDVQNKMHTILQRRWKRRCNKIKSSELSLVDVLSEQEKKKNMKQSLKNSKEWERISHWKSDSSIKVNWCAHHWIGLYELNWERAALVHYFRCFYFERVLDNWQQQIISNESFCTILHCKGANILLSSFRLCCCCCSFWAAFIQCHSFSCFSSHCFSIDK